ncbi:hypothetical protein [Streptomyces mirabilis]|uniref:hypothetical protein n=1 Tax=Streptomyces mirabilis TaxID=68239 RepID=UPI00225932BA|nr:hypothetical protein [Streptomyces mirabilis]MCX4431701.1 hypothetical protein [Streptomyces mirabilis]
MTLAPSSATTVVRTTPLLVILAPSTTSVVADPVPTTAAPYPAKSQRPLPVREMAGLLSV